MEFFKIVRYARKKNGWTQAELGAKIGVKDSNISDYEKEDGGMPRLENLQLMARLFGMTTSQLLGEVEVPTHLLFKDAAAAAAANCKWEEPIPAEPPKPLLVDSQEPARFMMWLNLDGCELLSVFHQMDVRARRILLGTAHNLLRDSK
jgi:transcriptional regulator with XRE-family HTH domain